MKARMEKAAEMKNIHPYPTVDDIVLVSNKVMKLVGTIKINQTPCTFPPVVGPYILANVVGGIEKWPPRQKNVKTTQMK